MAKDDFYRKGAPLGRRGLFQIACEEVFRDGQVDEEENRLLQKLASFLNLDAEASRTIARRARAKFEAGLLGEARPLKPRSLLGRVVRYIGSDGTLDDKERKMLSGLAGLLGIPEAEVMRSLEELLKPAGSEAEAKAQPKAGAKAEPKAEAKAEPKAGAKAEPKAEAKAEPKAGAKAEPRAEAKAEPKAEARAKAPPLPATEVTAMAEEAGAITTRLFKHQPRPGDGDAALALVARATGAWAHVEHRRGLQSVVFNLAAVLASHARFGELERAIEITYGAPAPPAGTELEQKSAQLQIANEYTALWLNCLNNLRSPPVIADYSTLIEMAVHLARPRPSPGYFWEGAANVSCRIAKLLAAAGDWKAHARALRALDDAPAELAPRLVSARSRMLRDAVEMASEQKQHEQAWNALEAMRATHAGDPQPELGKQYAIAISLILPAVFEHQKVPEDRLCPVLRDYCQLVPVVAPDMPGMGRSFGENAGSIACLLAYDAERQGLPSSHGSEVLRQACESMWEDQDFVFSFVMRISDACIFRKGQLGGLLPARDPALVEWMEMLGFLAVACPGHPVVVSAPKVYGDALGIRPRSLDGPRPAARVHAEVATLAALFEALQTTPADESIAAMIKLIIGYGAPYFARVVTEGVEVYAKDERYFLDLLKEIARQARADRSGFWRRELPRLDEVTQIMLADVPDSLLRPIMAFRDQLGMRSLIG